MNEENINYENSDQSSRNDNIILCQEKTGEGGEERRGKEEKLIYNFVDSITKKWDIEIDFSLFCEFFEPVKKLIFSNKIISILLVVFLPIFSRIILKYLKKDNEND